MESGKSATNFDSPAAKSCPNGCRNAETSKLPALFAKCMHCRLNWPENVYSSVHCPCQSIQFLSNDDDDLGFRAPQQSCFMNSYQMICFGAWDLSQSINQCGERYVGIHITTLACRKTASEKSIKQNYTKLVNIPLDLPKYVGPPHLSHLLRVGAGHGLSTTPISD